MIFICTYLMILTGCFHATNSSTDGYDGLGACSHAHVPRETAGSGPLGLSLCRGNSTDRLIMPIPGRHNVQDCNTFIFSKQIFE